MTEPGGGPQGLDESNGSHNLLLLQREVQGLRQDLRAYKAELHVLVRKELTDFRKLVVEEVRGLFLQEGGWLPREPRVPTVPSSPGTQRTQGSSYGNRADHVDPRDTPTQLLDSQGDTQGSQRGGADDTPSTCGACGQSDTQDPHSCSTRPRGLKLSAACAGPGVGKPAQGFTVADPRVDVGACPAVPRGGQHLRSQPPATEAAKSCPPHQGSTHEEANSFRKEDSVAWPGCVASGLNGQQEDRSAEVNGYPVNEMASAAQEARQDFAIAQDPLCGREQIPSSVDLSESGDRQASAGAQSNGKRGEPTKMGAVQTGGQPTEQGTGRQAALQWYTKKTKTPKGKLMQSRLGKQDKVRRDGGRGQTTISLPAQPRRRRVPKGSRLQFEEEDEEEEKLMQPPDSNPAAGRGDGTSQQKHAACPVRRLALASSRDVAVLRGGEPTDLDPGEGAAERTAAGLQTRHEVGLERGPVADLPVPLDNMAADSAGADCSERSAALAEGVTLGLADVATGSGRRGAHGEGGQVKEAKWRTTKRKRAREAMQGAVIHVLEEDDDFLSTPREKACLMRMQREHSQGEQEHRGGQGLNVRQEHGEGPQWSSGDDEEATDRNGRVSRPVLGVGAPWAERASSQGDGAGTFGVQGGALAEAKSEAQVRSVGVKEPSLVAATTTPASHLGQDLVSSGVPMGDQSTALVLPDSDETTRGSTSHPGDGLETTKGVNLASFRPAERPATARESSLELRERLQTGKGSLLLPRERLETARGASPQLGEGPQDLARLEAECKENLPAMGLESGYGEERQGHLRRALDGNGAARGADVVTAAEQLEMRRPGTLGTAPELQKVGMGVGDPQVRGAGGIGNGERLALSRSPQETERPGQEGRARGGELQCREEQSLSRQPVSVHGGAGAGGALKAPAYKYKDVVRRKADREALAAGDCVECRKFYDAVMAGDPNGLMAPCCQQHQEASRHRYRFAPPSTPQGFWNIGFDSDGS